MTSPIATNSDDMLLCGGVSRSGRVRKKSSKLLDFQSTDDVDKKLPKRATTTTVKSGNRRGRKPRSIVKDFESSHLVSHDADDNDLHHDDNVLDQDMDIDDALPHLSDLDSLNGSPADLTLDVKLLEEAANVTCGDIGHAMVSNQALLDNLLSGAPDSEDELNNLVADLVEGVQAECMEQSNKNLQTDQTVRQSLYMTEKSTNKRNMGKVERKDKGKARFTAYNLWSRDFRQSSKFASYQDLDAASITRRLGELWANVSVKEKAVWRRRAKQFALKSRDTTGSPKTPSYLATAIATAEVSPSKVASITASPPFLNRATTSRTKKLAEAAAAAAAAAVTTQQSKSNEVSTPKRRRYKSGVSPEINVSPQQPIIPPAATITTPTTSITPTATTISNNRLQSIKNEGHSSDTVSVSEVSVAGSNINAIDAASHLKLLGESLSIIGKRLKEHDGQIAVSGSLSVLLDSLLCSMGPLLCLATHIPGLENDRHLRSNLTNILDNIAYVMPGL